MTNKEKSEAYKKLVQDMLNKYPNYNFKDPTANTADLYAPYIDEETYCQEINFYTYWQGLGYAERTPKIKYLFVSQDCGGPFDDSEATKDFIERLRKMNAGDRSVSYINDKFNESETDKNLIILFEEFNYDLRKRYDDLFFTNFCLGCRRDSSVGMHRSWMWEDHELFKRLYDILEPENIITMGMRTFECVYKALTGKDYPGLGRGNFDNFKELVNNPKKPYIKRGRNTVTIYPMHHCGRHGIDNLIADPLAILRAHLSPIKANQPGPFAKYLIKLIEEYKVKHDGKAPNLETKMFSDLKCGKTKVPVKENVVDIINALRPTVEETVELLSRANCDISDIDNIINSDKSWDEVIDEEIVKRFKNKGNEKLNERLVNISLIYLAKQQNFDLSLEDIEGKIYDRLHYAEVKREKSRINKEIEEVNKKTKKWI